MGVVYLGGLRGRPFVKQYRIIFIFGQAGQSHLCVLLNISPVCNIYTCTTKCCHIISQCNPLSDYMR